jgi:uncharacterized RDD family membrane protein YckC
MACWLYESLLMFAVAFIADYLFSTLTQTRNAMDNRHEQQAFLFVVFGIYFVWFWQRGQTLAMKTWDIRVVDSAGQAISRKRAVLRYVLSWVWLLPPMAIAWLAGLQGMQNIMLVLGWIVFWALLARLHPSHQFWHDAWSGTQLISWRAPKKNKP